VATSRKAPKADSSVRCPICSFDIAILGGLRLPQEFSLLCPKCGWRRVYHLADLRDPQLDVTATHIFERIQFGKKKSMLQTSR
jgi:DNA-directed RNA polymerase subunit RPC12/RpoP